jgi:hypothetical protein
MGENMSIEPIKGHFEDWRALLAKIMEDDEVEHLVVFTFCKDGSVRQAHHKCTRAEMAFAGVMIAKSALEP